jgi:hypothetical protein
MDIHLTILRAELGEQCKGFKLSKTRPLASTGAYPSTLSDINNEIKRIKSIFACYNKKGRNSQKKAFYIPKGPLPTSPNPSQLQDE